MTPRTLSHLRLSALGILALFIIAVAWADPGKPPAVRSMERRIANRVRLRPLASYPLPSGGTLRVVMVPGVGKCVIVERREVMGRWDGEVHGDGIGLGIGLGVSCDFKPLAVAELP